MYAVHPIAFSEIKALKKCIPSFGWHSVVVVLFDGTTLPPLYFEQGGVRGFFSTLKQVGTVPSPPGLYIGTQEPHGGAERRSIR